MSKEFVFVIVVVNVTSTYFKPVHSFVYLTYICIVSLNIWWCNTSISKLRILRKYRQRLGVLVKNNENIKQTNLRYRYWQ